jgi:hypothetical protein
MVSNNEVSRLNASAEAEMREAEVCGIHRDAISEKVIVPWQIMVGVVRM